MEKISGLYNMKTIRLSCSHSLVRFLIAQKIMIDGEKMPLFAGAFGIYGHGNVACIGQAMEEYQNELPGYRGHHEQNMALTGIAYARAKRRKQRAKMMWRLRNRPWIRRPR